MSASKTDTAKLLEMLQHQVSRLKRELGDAYEAITEWRKMVEVASERMAEAEKLLWPSRHTNAKVRDHFAKWHDVDGKRAAWGGTDGRPERHLGG